MIYDGTPAVPHPFMFMPISTESAAIAPETIGSKVEFSMDIYTYSNNDCMYDSTILSSELEDEDLFFIKDGYDMSYWDKLANDGAAGPDGNFCKVVFDFSSPSCYMQGEESTCSKEEEKVLWYTYIDYTQPASWWDNIWGMLAFQVIYAYLTPISLLFNFAGIFGFFQDLIFEPLHYLLPPQVVSFQLHLNDGDLNEDLDYDFPFYYDQL